MSEKRCLRNAAEDYCFFGNSKRTLYVQVPMTMSEKKLSKSQFVILNARFSTLNVHLLLQTCVYFVNSPFFYARGTNTMFLNSRMNKENVGEIPVFQGN